MTARQRGGDEFYVGYQPEMPPRHARLLRRVILSAVVLSAAFAAAAAAMFLTPGSGRWEPEPEDFVGVLVERPYPVLIVDATDGPRAILLVDPGKFGAQSRTAGLNGARVRVRGTRLHRPGPGPVLVEMLPGANGVQRQEAPAESAPASTPTGTATLLGEVIDPKCFFGAMKPGSGKTHKACAIRCISGGVPPMLAVRSDARRGSLDFYLLSDVHGGPVNEAVLPFVGEHIEVAGNLERLGDLNILRIDPAAVRRR